MACQKVVAAFRGVAMRGEVGCRIDCGVGVGHGFIELAFGAVVVEVIDHPRVREVDQLLGLRMFVG